MAEDVDRGEVGFGYFDAFGIFVFVEFVLNGQSGIGCGGCDELDHRAKITQGFAAPVDADE